MTFLNKLTTFISFPILLTAISCDNPSRDKLLIGNWKMVVDTTGEDSPFQIDGRGVSYEFINDCVVDTKRRYYKITRSETREREYKFLGTVTKYKIVGDSLKFFDLTGSVWERGRLLKKVTMDSLTLINAEGQELTFLRHSYKVDKNTNVDAIALSSSGCFGTCPIINIIIESSGNVTFYGERYIGKIGFFEGQISKERFEQISAEFKKAEIEKLKQDYSVSWTDDETLSTTFVFKSAFVNSIEDYGESGPDELIWGYTTLRYLFEDLELKKLDSTNVPLYLDLHYFRFEKDTEVCDLTQSESFLLWNYLRKGSIVKTKVDSKFDLGFARNYIWAPNYDELDDPYKEESEEKVKGIKTDGRYFTFDIQGRNTITIDIGFNFFDINQKFLSFRKRGEYD